MPQESRTPPPKDPAPPFRITVVCLGNICRSPIGQAVLQHRVYLAGLADEVWIDSAGTGDWHLGHDADQRAKRILEDHGYPLSHQARQIDPSWIGSIDLLLAMDASNHADLQRIVAASGRHVTLRMFRSFDPMHEAIPDGDPRLDVPDPYYGGAEGFAEVLHMIESASDGLLKQLPDLIRSRNEGA